MTRKILLVLAMVLLIPLLGCEVVCPECPPPEVTCYPPNVTVTPEINIECPEPEITIRLEPKINVEIPEIENPEVNVSVKLWPYDDIRYSQEIFEVVMPNHLREIDYYPMLLKETRASYQGNGLWEIKCKFQGTGGVFWHSFVFSEVPGVDEFVE